MATMAAATSFCSVDVDALLHQLHVHAPGPCPSLVVSWLLTAGERRGDAFRMQAAGRAAGWDATIYVDPPDWIVRLTRTERVTRSRLTALARSVTELGQLHGLSLRGISVEQPAVADVWTRLAQRAADPPVPVPRPEVDDQAS